MRRCMSQAALALTVCSLLAAGEAKPDKVYSRQKAFLIPFQVPDGSQRNQLKEVQLYVSQDGGPWQKYTASPADVAPNKRRFVVRAEKDGEYRFAVRTLDRNGALHPANDADLQAGLVVVIDSQVPRIALRPIQTTGQSVGVTWELQDRNLDLSSFKLEYRVEGQQTWQPVPGMVPKFAGQVTWVPDQPGKVTVRAQVEDLAKNLSNAQIELRAGASAAQPALAASGRQSGPGTTGWPQRAGAAASPRSSLPPPTRSPAGGSGHAHHTGPMSNGQQVQQQPATPGYGRSSLSQGAAPAGYPPNRQIVRNTLISLDYQIEDQGPSGVSLVELWVTEDLGRSWKPLGQDPDRHSPFQVDLGRDGLYGLTMVAKSGVGLGGEPPKPGDQPQVWIEVDTSPPTVQLYEPQIGTGPQAGTVQVSWRAEDRNLDPRPVSLFYAATGSSDWKPITTGLPNTGRYVWKLEGSVPPRFRVAIEVVDRAGNRQMQESDELVIDTSRPTPRITNVRPAGERRY